MSNPLDGQSRANGHYTQRHSRTIPPSIVPARRAGRAICPNPHFVTSMANACAHVALILHHFSLPNHRPRAGPVSPLPKQSQSKERAGSCIAFEFPCLKNLLLSDILGFRSFLCADTGQSIELNGIIYSAVSTRNRVLLWSSLHFDDVILAIF